MAVVFAGGWVGGISGMSHASTEDCCLTHTNSYRRLQRVDRFRSLVKCCLIIPIPTLFFGFPAKTPGRAPQKRRLVGGRMSDRASTPVKKILALIHHTNSPPQSQSITPTTHNNGKSKTNTTIAASFSASTG
jgi:hypothetical protein